MTAASPVIAVFGSARVDAGSDQYQQAVEVGRLLAASGLAVATGGYMGVMEAVSKGAHEAGGRVIGVTADQVEAARPGRPNSFLTEEIRYPTLIERLSHLVTHNNGMIALTGGIGTLAEVAVAWELRQKGGEKRKPVVLLGPVWKQLLALLAQDPFVTAEELRLIELANSPAEAVRMVVGKIFS